MSVKVIEGTDDKDKERVAKFIQDVLSTKKFNDLIIKKSFIIHRDFRPNNLMYKIEVNC